MTLQFRHLHILTSRLLLVVLALTLGACSSTPPEGKNISEIAPQSFYEDQAKLSFDAGSKAMDAGNLNIGIGSFEKAIRQWPPHITAWEKLFKAYEIKGDNRGMNYSAYFGKRIVWANSMPPRIAASAFENVLLINEERPFEDTRIPETAERLITFFKQRQSYLYSRDVTQFKKQENMWGKYLIYPVAIISVGVMVYSLKSKLLPSSN